jgi:hypothetical protein
MRRKIKEWSENILISHPSRRLKKLVQYNILYAKYLNFKFPLSMSI